MLSMCNIMIGAFLNAQLAYMLEDSDMFNTPASMEGQYVSQLTIYSLPFSMITTGFISYVYELLGRRWTIFYSYLNTAIVMASIPYTAPSYTRLLIVRCLMGVTMAAPVSHPLIPDYIKRSSRGQAVAMAGIGFVFGEVFSMGVLFNLTKRMSFKNAFAITCAIITIFGIYFLITVKEPDMKEIRVKITLKSEGVPTPR